MEQFVDYMLTKQAMADALRSILATRDGLRLHSREALLSAMTTLANASITAGQIRADTSTSDIPMALGGITHVSGHEHQRDLASRLITLLLDGLLPTQNDTADT